MISVYLLLDFVPQVSQIPTDFLPLKVTQISQMTQISFTFLPLKVPTRISRINTTKFYT